MTYCKKDSNSVKSTFSASDKIRWAENSPLTSMASRTLTFNLVPETGKKETNACN